MSISGRASQAKRNRERANQERSAEKRAERARRNELKKERKSNFSDEQDPDLIGIVPGPQAPPVSREEERA